MATPGVGEDIEDICTRCGDTWHVVMAKLGERVVKVVCKLCGSQHNYRGEKNPPAPTSAGTWGRTRRRRTGRTTTAAEQPEVSFDPSKPPRGYSPRDVYAPGERVVHATFGVGVVAAVAGPGKVDVQFPAGARTLACAKSSERLERPVAVQGLTVPDSPEPKTGPHRS